MRGKKVLGLFITIRPPRVEKSAVSSQLLTKRGSAPSPAGLREVSQQVCAPVTGLVPPQLPHTPISPELRHNVFLATKEAVNNVVKHAKATSVWVRLHLNNDSFILEVEDNGRGIAKADEQKGRNGLRNMRKRLEDVGGRFETGPGAEGGTRVRLIVPVGNT